MASDSDSSLNYLDLDLEIGLGTGREYPVAIVRSPAGEARATMRFPFDELALDSRLKDLQIALLRSGGKRRQALTREESAARDFGKQLFDALIIDEVRSRYDVSQREAVLQGKGLRVKLRIASPELAALPWEFLYDSRQAEYVCLSTNTPVVRYFELPQPIQPLRVTLPIRVLGMIVSPTDLPKLDVDREKQRVDNALQALQARGTVEVTWLEGRTWRDLQRAMRSGTWHIFHFIGHGGFDSNADEGLIAVADDDGKAEYLNATQLGRLLADHRSLRLVLLNSCEGARSSERDLFSSTASILVRRGIPAVLAMQYEITDRAAIEFSRAFYEAIADGLPVDAATAEARKAISFAVTNTMEWGTPVLFMRAPDGMLFKLQPLTIVDRQAQQAAQLEKERLEDRQSTKEQVERQAVEKAKLQASKRKARVKTTSKPVAAPTSERQGPKLKLKEQPAPVQATFAPSDLIAELIKAESQRNWNSVIELGERILKQDANHQPARSKTAQAYRERGVSYHNNDDYNRAVADFNHAIELDSSKADYFYSRGLSYDWKKDKDRAIIDYTQAIQLEPNNAEYYQSRGNAYSWLNQYDQAIADHSKAIQLDPTKPDYFWERGRRYHSKKEYERAIADYNRAITLGSKNAKYYFERGKCYHEKKEYDRAIIDYTQAIQLEPNNAEYYQSRGNAYSWLNQYDQAIADHSKAIQLDPKPDYFWERGRRYLAQKQYTRALADFTHAIELDSNQAEYFQSRGNCYSWMNEYDKAITDHSKAIQLDSTKPDYFWERGKRYQVKQDYDRAIADYDQAIALDSKNADYFFERGKSYYSKKEYDRAIADYTRAIEIYPDQADYYWERGKSYSWKSDWEAAKRDYRRAADMGHAEARKELAKF